MKGLAAVLLFVGGCASFATKTPVLTGQNECAFKATITKTVEMGYLLYLPKDYAGSTEKYPLILFLHGAGERGNNLTLVKTHGPPMLAALGKEFPFIIVSPQCPEEEWWSSECLVMLLDEVASRYRVDKDRVYVTGLSMGGFGTWDLAIKYPERFAAIAPICGGGNPKKVGGIKDLPTWVFHGAKDQTVPVSKSQEMVDALKKAGSDVKFTVYPEADHNSWTVTYDNPELYEWFLQHHRKSNGGAKKGRSE
jgi:predicted peptidase